MTSLSGPEDLVEPALVNLIRFPFERRSDHQWSVVGLDAVPELIEKHHASMIELGRDECGHPGCWACYPARE